MSDRHHPACEALRGELPNMPCVCPAPPRTPKTAIEVEIMRLLDDKWRRLLSVEDEDATDDKP